MRAFYVKLKNGDYSDVVIRAPDENAAQSYVTEDDVAEVGEIKANVATAMAVPDTEGRHPGVLSRYGKGNIDIFGTLLQP